MAIQGLLRLAQARLNLYCCGNAVTDSCGLVGIRGYACADELLNPDDSVLTIASTMRVSSL